MPSSWPACGGITHVPEVWFGMGITYRKEGKRVKYHRASASQPSCYPFPLIITQKNDMTDLVKKNIPETFVKVY